MDVPISIGVTLVAAMSLFETMTSGRHAYFDSAITLLFFLLIGRYLDRRARARARSAIEQMMALGNAIFFMSVSERNTVGSLATSGLMKRRDSLFGFG